VNVHDIDLEKRKIFRKWDMAKWIYHANADGIIIT
jgi:hypothetical protein